MRTEELMYCEVIKIGMQSKNRNAILMKNVPASTSNNGPSQLVFFDVKPRRFALA